MNHEFAHIIGGSQWLMEPKAFRAMVKRAEAATPDAIQAAVKAYSDRPPSLHMMGDVAVIHMCGPITYRRSWFSMFFGSATIEDMQTQFRMARRDESVKAIAFRGESGGGEVTMVPEFADEIYAARGEKPIIGIADTMVCSAALWIMAQCDQLYVSASSQVGSCGVFLEHEDISAMLEKIGVKMTLIAYGKHKVDGNSYEPLSDDVKADLQQEVNDVGLEFDAAMARGRGVSRKVVADQFGQGKVFRGKKIIAAGLADKFGTFSQAMQKLTKGRAMAAVGTGAIQGDVDLPVIEAATVQASVCECCGKSSCACTADTCGSDCPTCSPECPCVRPAEDAKAETDTEAGHAAADNDALAVALALSE